MYTLSVRRGFIAAHYLVGGDWGVENKTHSHHYRVELRMRGQDLDRHGYLVDIVEVEAALDEIIASYRDRVLNDLHEFQGINPSLEHFARLLWQAFMSRFENVREGVEVRVWEDDTAWAGYAAKR